MERRKPKKRIHFVRDFRSELMSRAEVGAYLRDGGNPWQFAVVCDWGSGERIRMRCFTAEQATSWYHWLLRHEPKTCPSIHPYLEVRHLEVWAALSPSKKGLGGF